MRHAPLDYPGARQAVRRYRLQVGWRGQPTPCRPLACPFRWLLWRRLPRDRASFSFPPGARCVPAPRLRAPQPGSRRGPWRNRHAFARSRRAPRLLQRALHWPPPRSAAPWRGAAQSWPQPGARRTARATRHQNDDVDGLNAKRPPVDGHGAISTAGWRTAAAMRSPGNRSPWS